MHNKEKKKRRGWLIALLVVLLLFLAIAVSAVLFINSKLNLIDYSDGAVEQNELSAGEETEDDFSVDISALEKIL